jgi:hypothetical protein
MGLFCAGPPLTLIYNFERMPCGLMRVHGSVLYSSSPHSLRNYIEEAGHVDQGVLNGYIAMYSPPTSSIMKVSCRGDHVGLWRLMNTC